MGTWLPKNSTGLILTLQFLGFCSAASTKPYTNFECCMVSIKFKKYLSNEVGWPGTVPHSTILPQFPSYFC